MFNEKMKLSSFILFLALVSVISCGDKPKPEVTPWGETIGEDGAPVEQVDSGASKVSLDDIVDAGEMIMLTISGPETYYDYRGHGMGVQYLLCEKFAQKLGVLLRVEVCKDSAEVMKRLADGEGDIAVFSDYSQWKVADAKGNIATELKNWYKPELVAQVKQEMHSMLSIGMVKRHVYPFMLNRKDAVISRYDALFRQYAPVAGCDWTLIAAQCYQESCFDPRAHSWAGACGLMQIMPGTADLLGLSRAQIYEPEANIAAACKYMAQLQGKFSDIPVRGERLKFALACYNGGYHHIRDAMALAKKNGRNPQRWSDVREFVLGLQSPRYYNDPVVKNGYMRGSETVDYVDKIIDRWNQYRGATRGKYGSGVNATPKRSKHKNKWVKEN